jgi:hypothetical protein
MSVSVIIILYSVPNLGISGAENQTQSSWLQKWNVIQSTTMILLEIKSQREETTWKI